MARTTGNRPPRPRGHARDEAGGQPAPAGPPAAAAGNGPRGARYLFLLREGATDAALARLREVTGVEFANTANERKGYVAPDELGGRGLVLDRLGVAVVALTPDQLSAFDTLPENGPVLML